jgi:hypothetical protein
MNTVIATTGIMDEGGDMLIKNNPSRPYSVGDSILRQTKQIHVIKRGFVLFARLRHVRHDSDEH